mgnify:CR=1 FL=1
MPIIGVWIGDPGLSMSEFFQQRRSFSTLEAFEMLAAHLKGSEIDIDVDLGIGEGRATVWTCDLTHGYISINADYRS